MMLTAAAALFALAGIAWAFGPENPEEAMQRGWARARAGHFAAAARDFSEVLRTHPRAANARLLHGCCLAGLGKSEAAIADFNECLLLNGDNAAAWHDRGLAYQALGDWKQAAHDFDMALQLKK